MYTFYFVSIYKLALRFVPLIFSFITTIKRVCLTSLFKILDSLSFGLFMLMYILSFPFCILGCHVLISGRRYAWQTINKSLQEGSKIQRHLFSVIRFFLNPNNEPDMSQFIFLHLHIGSITEILHQM